MSEPVPPSLGFAGEVTAAQAWERLAADPAARLVDVRTQAEWAFVGVPDLSALARQPILLSWQVFPTMAVNEDFAAQLAGHGVTKADTLYFLCRSGARSKAACEVMNLHGYRQCWNILDGFEGPLDADRHRGRVAGWKAAGLPWVQG